MACDLHLSAAFDEESIGHLHDVGLVNCAYFLAPIVAGILECILCYPCASISGDHLQSMTPQTDILCWSKVKFRLMEKRDIFPHLQIDLKGTCDKHNGHRHTFRLSTTPGITSCSNPLYSPSVFSRIVIRLTSSYLHNSMTVSIPLDCLHLASQSMTGCMQAVHASISNVSRSTAITKQC
jgi:hypothetical protein